MSYVPHAQLPPLLPPPRDLSRISFRDQDIHNGPLSPPIYSPQTLAHRKTTPVSIKEQQVPLSSCKPSNPAFILPPRPRRITSAEISVHLGITIKAPSRQAQPLVRPEHDAFAGQQFLFQQSTAPPAVAVPPCAPYRLPSTCLPVMTCPPRTPNQGSHAY